MGRPLEQLTRQLLGWVAERPRTYSEAMEAWRTSCPRLPVWENAISDGLVQVDRGGGGITRVILTARGRQFLASEEAPT